MNRTFYPNAPTVTGKRLPSGMISVTCPYCGKEQEHSYGADMTSNDGSHRISHCRAPGAADGYFIKIRAGAA